MKCKSCVYKRLDGRAYPCYKCVECGYPYLEDVPVEELEDRYVDARDPLSYPAAVEVVKRVEKYLANELPTYQLHGVWRKSLHPEDRALFFVLAESKAGFSVWTCWNDETHSLNHGHYNLSKEDALSLMKEEFNFI